MKVLKLCRYVAISLAALFMANCTSILDQPIIQTPVAGNAWQTPMDVNQGVAGAYDLLRTALPNKLFMFGEARSGIYQLATSNNVRPYSLVQNNSRTELLGGGTDWTDFYRVIAQANLILEMAGTISGYGTGEFERYTGEAAFIRALTYFTLARMFGDVPLQLQGIQQDAIARTSQQQIFEQIIDDLDYAISNLAVEYATGDRAVRATRGSAQAIKAHVLAWLHRYEEAEQLCSEVIDNGQYQMVTDSASLISVFVGKSREGIFELNFSSDQAELRINQFYQHFLGRPWYRDVSDGGGGSENYLLIPRPAIKTQLFPTGQRDIRRGVWYIESTWNSDIPFLGKYRTLQGGSADTLSQNINESNIIITRLPDIILLRAESLAELNRNSEAAMELNKVRMRAMRPIYAGDGNIRDTILLERRVELIGEGHFFFDLVRTRQMPRYHPSITTTDWYENFSWSLPIHPNVLARSNNLIENYPIWF
ncbi:RagB/SusD family nutrient uptake outer membrane protein [Sphingobacterium bambusae]|uniref:RagB/SusD family nutrient uptake outer membrane protein n=1 Tax=Sphingobacterium bambusae TaxID=662858 RepID=A0ABW6BNC1_9SPHI|nr:RagB/SusD family nutrient uptake outer membrane protein [Sphingobacterium bambusae]WPL50906.1 RagB/SusD family nutrient uptake outer membrane protein [Sphingobacterium bambusae]